MTIKTYSVKKNHIDVRSDKIAFRFKLTKKKKTHIYVHGYVSINGN